MSVYDNILSNFANIISKAVMPCVQWDFSSTPKKIETSTETKPRPNAMVLLNAHGIYPYGLFIVDDDDDDIAFTRQTKAEKYQEYTIDTNIKNILENTHDLYKDVISTLFKNIKYTSSVPAPYCGMMVGRI